MMFPLDLPHTHPELSLVVAMLVGFGFGFTLERAGFGRSTTLAAQFYFRDMTVLKVMFGAIVTAMLGLVILQALGIADLKVISEGAVSYTYLWPMIAGGFLLGVGFIVSGYCPGTSLVATASGNLDGLVTLVGVVIGSVLYSEVQPLVAGFHNSGDFGWVFLYDLLGVSPAVVAAGVVVMAVLMFLGAEQAEAYFARRQGVLDEEQRSPRGPRRAVLATFGVLALAGAASLALPVATVQAVQETVDRISAEELAQRLFEQPWRLRILDVRPQEACAAARVPGAECAPLETLADLGLAWASGTKELVLVGDSPLEPLPAEVRAYPGAVVLLDGGFAAWKAYVLDTPQAPTAGASESERQAYALRSGLHAALTGVAAPPPPAAGPAVAFTPKKKKGGGGCN